jgi:hypothetical protein
LLRNDYTPLVNIDKRPKLKGWPDIEVTEELITGRWSRMHDKATGMRLGAQPSGRILGAIDCDVSLKTVLDAIIARWCEYLPGIFDDADVPLLERGTTASCKVAFFLRISEPFGRLATHDFEDDDGGLHKVEIFGGGSARQFGAFGLHNAATGSTYVWRADSPLDVPLARLPSLNKGQCARLVEIAENVMLSKGMKQVERLHDDDDDGEIVYDITDDMEFESGDSVYSLAELKAVLASTDSLRISGSWHDPASANLDNPRCIARLLKDGALMITDFGDDGRRHMEADRGVAPDSEEAYVSAFAALGTVAAATEPPKKGDTAATVLVKLLHQFVYCRNMKTAVISLLNPVTDCSTQQAFISDMAKYSQTINGEVFHPGKMWMVHADRISVLGRQMRPDRLRPLYDEGVGQWVNTYQPPVFAGAGGDASIGIELMEQLAPDGKDRAYFLQMLAYKLRHPAVPGPATINVANDRFGSGRGTLGALLGKLFGDEYVKTIPFASFAGQGTQGQYNTWAFDSLFVLVNETMRLDGRSYHSQKHDTYEVMKERLEPRAGPREMVVKGVNNVQRLSFCTYIINTNSIDSIPIPAHDRRCFVLENGETREPEFWERVYAWMENPANITAFALWLMSIDLTGYKPYATPPMTAAKEEMADAGASPLDQMLDEVLATLKGRSELFSLKHVEDGVTALMQLDQSSPIDGWRGVIGKSLRRRNVYRVGVKNGNNWQPKIGTRRFATYAWTKAAAKKWTPADPSFVRKELERCGTLDNFESVFKDLSEAMARGATKTEDPE